MSLLTETSPSLFSGSTPRATPPFPNFGTHHGSPISRPQHPGTSLQALSGQISQFAPRALLPELLPSRGWEPEPGSSGGRGARTKGTKVVRKRRRCCLMFPSTTSLGNLLLKSVRETAHIWEAEVIFLPSTALQTFPSRAAYREHSRARLKSPEIQAALAERRSPRFRPQAPDHRAAHSRKRGAEVHCGRRGSPRPGAG